MSTRGAPASAPDLRGGVSTRRRTRRRRARGTGPALAGGHPNRRSLGVARRYDRRSAAFPRRWRSPGRLSGLLVPVEVARRLLLEPQTVVLGRLLEEVRRLLEHVLLALGLGLLATCLERLLGRHLVGLVVEPRVLVVAGRGGGVVLRRDLGDARLAVGELVDRRLGGGRLRGRLELGHLELRRGRLGGLSGGGFSRPGLGGGVRAPPTRGPPGPGPALLSRGR